MAGGDEQVGGVNLKPVLTEQNAIILLSEEFFLLHEIILAYPEGLGGVLSLDPRIVTLLNYGFVEQKAYRWFPTEAGVNHVMPQKSTRH